MYLLGNTNPSIKMLGSIMSTAAIYILVTPDAAGFEPLKLMVLSWLPLYAIILCRVARERDEI